jgi:hypothetical protein
MAEDAFVEARLLRRADDNAFFYVEMPVVVPGDQGGPSLLARLPTRIVVQDMLGFLLARRVRGGSQLFYHSRSAFASTVYARPRRRFPEKRRAREKDVDKWRGKCFNTNIIGPAAYPAPEQVFEMDKGDDGIMPLPERFQRAGGWCEPVPRVTVQSASRAGLANRPPAGAVV